MKVKAKRHWIVTS